MDKLILVSKLLISTITFIVSIAIAIWSYVVFYIDMSLKTFIRFTLISAVCVAVAIISLLVMYFCGKSLK